MLQGVTVPTHPGWPEPDGVGGRAGEVAGPGEDLALVQPLVVEGPVAAEGPVACVPLRPGDVGQGALPVHVVPVHRVQPLVRELVPRGRVVALVAAEGPLHGGVGREVEDDLELGAADRGQRTLQHRTWVSSSLRSMWRPVSLDLHPPYIDQPHPGLEILLVDVLVASRQRNQEEEKHHRCHQQQHFFFWPASTYIPVKIELLKFVSGSSKGSDLKTGLFLQWPNQYWYP